MGSIVISLDFELLWGLLPLPQTAWPRNFQTVHETVPRILDLFRENQMAATWACVGMLMHENWEEWRESIPAIRPEYDHRPYCPYEFAEKNLHLPRECFFAPDLVQRIAQTPNQEIGTHTYSHYYCSVQGADPGSFAVDLQTAIGISEKQGYQIKSLVFPRNQLRPELLKVIAQLGIENVRSNPAAWYWNVDKNRIGKRLFRGIDSYVPLGEKSVAAGKIEMKDGVSLLPASRFFRFPQKSRGSFLDKLAVRRIKQEMTDAAGKNLVYHLWWHPHNLAHSPDRSLQVLEIICSHYRKLRENIGFESLTMKALGQQVRQSTLA
jgi:hypothetical protein